MKAAESRMNSGRGIWLRGVAALAALALVAGASVQAAEEEGAGGPGFWIKGGPVYRGGLKTEVSGSSRTQIEGVHAGGALRAPSGIGSANSYADRTYDDGFVKRDPGTGDPASIDPSVTWYWGYDNGSQYNPGAGTLTFHRQGSEGYQEMANTALSDDDKMNVGGAEVVAGMPVSKGTVGIDLCVGLQGFLDADAELGGSTYEEGVGRFDVADTYDVSAINVPAPGYRGTYQGPFDTPPVVPSPTIPNRPVSRKSTLRDMQWSARNAVSLEAETDLFELWIGPRLALQAADRVSLNLTPKLSVNYVDVSVDRVETFVATTAAGARTTIKRWSEGDSKSQFVFGAGLTAGADVEVTEHLFAGLWGGYEWVSEEVDVDAGPNTVSVDASGFTAGAAAGYRF